MSESHPVTLSQIIHFLEQWAPPGSAQSYDNVGLQVGDPGTAIRRVIVALDLTPAVLREAGSEGANLIITHHPLLFRPLKRVTPESWAGGLALRLAEKGIALYSIHTNLDAVKGGVSFALAKQLGLQDIRILSPATEAMYKLVTFVPASHLDLVREAVANAGAGQIGDYAGCAFTSPGTGYFKPGESSNPFIGSSGGPLESVQEVKLEVDMLEANQCLQLFSDTGFLDRSH